MTAAPITNGCSIPNPPFFKRRFYIDPDVTLAENRLKSHDVIIAKRVANEIVNYKEY